MRNRTLMISCSMAVIAAGSWGVHITLSALADRQVELVIERLEQRLPQGTQFRYGNASGNPYSASALIEELQMASVFGDRITISELQISGVKHDGQGELVGIRRLAARDASLELNVYGEITASKFHVEELDVHQLSYFANNFDPEQLPRITDIPNLDIDDLIATVDDVRLELDHISARASEGEWILRAGGGLVTERSSGVVLSLDELRAMVRNARPSNPPPAEFSAGSPLALNALPGTAELTGVSLSALGQQITAQRISAAFERSDKSEMTSNYHVTGLTSGGTYQGQLIGDIGELIASGEAVHSFVEEKTAISIQIQGERFGQLDLKLKVRGLALPRWAIREGAAPLNGKQSMALIGAQAAFLDYGWARKQLDQLAAELETTRAALAGQFTGYVHSFGRGRTSQEMSDLLVAIRSFVEEPDQLSINLDPDQPIGVAAVALAAILDPFLLPDLLGLSISAE